jgi:hypothetical protein
LYVKDVVKKDTLIFYLLNNGKRYVSMKREISIVLLVNVGRGFRMKMKSNVECWDRWEDYPNRTCLSFCGLESTALANFDECSCGECDFCQSVCGCECDCLYCERNGINGFSEESK